MTREQLDKLTDQFLSATHEEIERRLTLDWSEVGLEVHRDDLCQEAEALSGGLANVSCEAGMPWARAMLPEAEEETLRMLARRLMEAKLEAIRAELDALMGEPLRLSRRTYAAPEAPIGQAPLPPVVPSLRLSEVAAQYAEERVARKSWNARSAVQYREINAVIVNLLGDPVIAEVTKADIRRLGLDLVKYPSNAKKKFPGLTPREVLTAAEDDTNAVPRLSPNSVNMYLQAARSLFNWAEEHDLISRSPATVLRYVDAGLADEDRDPFTDEDLRAYFAKLDSEVEAPPFLRWIPRILAYTGCRLSEVAQLEKADVYEDQEVWVFDINANHPQKRLKNKFSKRKIPVHPRLVELGLLDFIRSCPDGFLWPSDIRTAKEDSRSSVDKLQKLLAYRLRSAGVTDERKTAAHSFRHTVSDRLQSQDVPAYQISTILGHKNDDMSTGRYGTKSDLKKRLEVLSLVTLPV